MSTNDILAVLSAVLATSIFTGLATAIFNQIFGHYRERAALTRDARYLAIRVAVILEQFGIECAERIATQEKYRSTEGGTGRLFGAVPELLPYPDEAKWESLDAGLLARALSLRNELPLSDRAIAFWEDIDRECIPQECDQQCGKCGYIAWQLAVAIRSHYSFPPFDPKLTSWDVVKTLQTEHGTALRMARERLDRIEKE